MSCCWSLAVGGPAHAQSTPVKIAILGDSLAAGYGVKPEQAFPARLEAALKAQGRNVTVLNQGVSGDTTAGGLDRLDWMLADKPDIVLVELGGNDALRGLDPAATEKQPRCDHREAARRPASRCGSPA